MARCHFIVDTDCSLAQSLGVSLAPKKEASGKHHTPEEEGMRGVVVVDSAGDTLFRWVLQLDKRSGDGAVMLSDPEDVLSIVRDKLVDRTPKLTGQESTHVQLKLGTTKHYVGGPC